MWKVRLNFKVKKKPSLRISEIVSFLDSCSLDAFSDGTAYISYIQTSIPFCLPFPSMALNFILSEQKRNVRSQGEGEGNQVAW